ncbi:conserved exported hypothetical protein [Halomonas sp. A3H3]|jgi:hypothetical protein|uniref:hypothetical protein n=1 Tax=Halomonas sp. A3H3 TaxID=1346287 RepID=UPI00038D035E|nr:hypothetical protein [Halomonas sp. A3H3]CDG56042.1 conserved exported hypothetical protein [Halomonas sp. A3H3]
MGKLKVQQIAFICLALVSMGSYGSPIERISDQANALASGTASSKEVVQNGGQRPFMFTPNNGYVGLETRLDVSMTYTSFEHGGQNVRQVEKAVVDWGDGSNATTVTPGTPAYHTYGHRTKEGSITPNGSVVYTGRITFVTTSGDAYTERFQYSMWNNFLDSLVPGGRVLPNQLLPSVNGAGSRDKLPSGFFDRNNK